MTIRRFSVDDGHRFVDLPHGFLCMAEDAVAIEAERDRLKRNHLRRMLCAAEVRRLAVKRDLDHAINIADDHLYATAFNNLQRKITRLTRFINACRRARSLPPQGETGRVD